MPKPKKPTNAAPVRRLQTFVPVALLEGVRSLSAEEGVYTDSDIVRNALVMYKLLLENKGKPITLCVQSGVILQHIMREQNPTP